MICLVNIDSFVRYFVMKCEVEDVDVVVSFYDSMWWFLKFFDFLILEV